MNNSFVTYVALGVLCIAVACLSACNDGPTGPRLGSLTVSGIQACASQEWIALRVGNGDNPGIAMLIFRRSQPGKSPHILRIPNTRIGAFVWTKHESLPAVLISVFDTDSTEQQIVRAIVRETEIRTDVLHEFDMATEDRVIARLTVSSYDVQSVAAIEASFGGGRLNALLLSRDAGETFRRVPFTMSNARFRLAWVGQSSLAVLDEHDRVTIVTIRDDSVSSRIVADAGYAIECALGTELMLSREGVIYRLGADEPWVIATAQHLDSILCGDRSILVHAGHQLTMLDLDGTLISQCELVGAYRVLTYLEDDGVALGVRRNESAVVEIEFDDGALCRTIDFDYMRYLYNHPR